MFEEENSIAAEVEDSHSHPSQEGESTSKMLSGTAEGDSTNNSTTREMLAKRESIAVFRLRLFFMAILVVTATVVSYLIHHVTRSGETDAAKAQYEAATDKINTSFKGIMNKMGSVSGLGVAITSEALDHEASWPFVSMRDFQQKAENALHVSGARKWHYVQY